MKDMRGLLIGVAGIVVTLCAGRLSAQEQATSTMQAFMRQKLIYSQNVLEGLTLERNEMVITNASRLMYMTRSNLWMEVGVPDYLDKTGSYQNNVIELVSQARSTNNAGMLKAYGAVIASCLDCHQAFRPAQATNVLSGLSIRLNEQRSPKQGAIDGAKTVK